MRSRQRRGCRLGLAVAALLLVAAPACASDGSDGSSDDASAGTSGTPAGPAAATSIRVVGENIAFDPTRITAPAGKRVTITFENRDRGIRHNFHLDGGAAGDFTTEVAEGPATQVLGFTIRQPGSYRYVCDVHPAQMRGTLTVH